MALIAKGVIDITCSLFNAIVHVLLRDLTNYYWYVDENERQNDAAVEGLISNLNDEDFNRLRSIEGNESTEFENGSECEGESVPYESFCTSLNIEDSASNVLDEICSIEDNTMVQDYEDNFKNVETLVKESSNHIPDDTNKIQNIDENAVNENNGDNLNCLRSCLWTETKNDQQAFEDTNLNQDFPKQENCIWVEINNDQPTLEDRNLNHDFLNITDASGHNCEEEREATINVQTEKLELVPEMEEKSNPLLLDNLNESTETYTLKNDEETGENLHIDENITDILKNYDESSKNLFIGDRKKSGTEFQNDNKSDISSECELGIKNFQIQNLIDECSKVGQPEAPHQKKKGSKGKMKSKISRYIGNTPLPKVRESSILETASTVEPKVTSEEIEKMHLQPITYCEITSTQSLLKVPQETAESEINVVPSKFTESQDDLYGLSNIPAESDFGSVCSDDSWDSWLGKFASIMQSKSPVKNPGVSFTETYEPDEADLTKMELCDCITQHPCLLVVDSEEEEVTADLLSPEQLGSVETGSVSDWLYRVSPANPLLLTKRKLNETETYIIDEHEQNANLYSESSDEDLAKQFFIEQWLYNTGCYYNYLNSKFIGSGDVL